MLVRIGATVKLMQHRPLGISETVFSTPALGTMTVGKEADEATSHSTLDAFEGGR